MATAPHPAIRKSRRPWFYSIAVILFSALLVVPAHRYLCATAVLLHIQDSHTISLLSRVGEHAVEETNAPLTMGNASLRGRMYTPQGVAHPPALVLIHGVHHLGVQEPRLVNFARTLASQGILVYTPELPAIADYTIDATSEPIIVAAVNDISRRTGAARVGLMGLSFSGGLALVAATNPACADRIAYVVAIGAHHDLERVLTFFATDRVYGPDGIERTLQAHEYGPLVVVYSHPREFFSAADAPIAREAIGLLLWEHVEESHAMTARLSSNGKARMAELYNKHRNSVSETIVRNMPEHRAALAAASPRGRLAQIRVPVLLLHGAGDDVIPATETQWLASEIPPEYLKAMLISPAISHVEMKGPGLRDKLALVRWMATLLDQTEASARTN